MLGAGFEVSTVRRCSRDEIDAIIRGKNDKCVTAVNRSDRNGYDSGETTNDNAFFFFFFLKKIFRLETERVPLVMPNR